MSGRRKSEQETKAQRSLQPGPKSPLAHGAPVRHLSLEVNVGGPVTINVDS